MRRNRVIRFLLGAFVAGAVIGLVAGLAFGGSQDTPTVVAQSTSNGSAETSTTLGQQAVSGTMTSDVARTIGANEMGQILVLAYEQIGTAGSDGERSPDDFRKDLALLQAKGFYPITANDLVTGNIDIPAGKSPVLITFDDSASGQYRILDDESVDPDSAVGIMQAAVKAGGWQSKATFFCLTSGSPKDNVLFGQSDKQQEKLRNLVEWGYEIGSHTSSHVNLKKASQAEAIRQLGESNKTLSKLVGSAYSVTSLSLPGNGYPTNESILSRGVYYGFTYTYTAVLANGSTMTPSPFSTGFSPLHIVRLEVTGDALSKAIENFDKHPELKYISDGDPTAVSAPNNLASGLGTLRTNLGRPVVRY